MHKLSLAYFAVTILILLAFVPTFVFAHARVTAASTGVGNIPQGNQSNAAYANSHTANSVTNVDATTQKTSCYTPEVPYAVNNGPNDGYSGETACGSASTTGEDPGPYPTQAGSNPGSPASTPMLVKDHSESDIRVDPTNPKHLIGSSKWVVSPEGYNHLLGFYESFDGGQNWTVQGHIPGYEGWTDNTDPVGAFDSFGNYYEFILAYQFFYNKDGSHNVTVGTSRSRTRLSQLRLSPLQYTRRARRLRPTGPRPTRAIQTTSPPMIALVTSQISSGSLLTPINSCPTARPIPTTTRSMRCGRCSTASPASRTSRPPGRCLMGHTRTGPRRSCSPPSTTLRAIPIYYRM